MVEENNTVTDFSLIYERAADDLSRITKINVSHSRAEQTGAKFGSESFFCSREIDFTPFWNSLGDLSKRGPEELAVINKGFRKSMIKTVGKTINDCYVFTLVAAIERIRELNMPQLGLLEEELSNLKEGKGFDPFNVRKKTE